MRAAFTQHRFARTLGVLSLAVALAAPVSACKFCRPGSEYDRYTPDDPMSAFAPDAATIARGQEGGAPPTATTASVAPKPEELVTSRAALTAAMASAPVPAPDSPAPVAGSYRERLLRPVSYSPPAAAPPITSTASSSAGLSVSAARVLDGALVLAVLGVVGFFLRRPRKGSEETPAVLGRVDAAG